ncbi:uroporphyrinogen-III synthase [Halomonas sp. TRM85114]|uniref:uroporphyrinogen-III synthase n=1 Tax=Halomonas jincaotanensis TaxID=2810616 RepID=UPI001BD28E02|nr:uroporphyrinogen-III synthase [Halomonas jincaotanensis]MBS9404686.1 uroporphyrinogen-III synthase [Halomonas jincaotanensis]
MTNLPVLVCRPGDRGEVLAASIEASGYRVARLTAMQLEPLAETPLMRRTWMDIDHFAKVVVISPFAAERLAEALDRYWPQLPIGIAYYAVGAATAGVLHERLGVRAHLPPVQAGEDTSEALLRLASLNRVEAQRVLLVAGEGGRTLIAETLAERGARLTRLAVYRRGLRTPSLLMQQRLMSGEYRALVVSSGEILEHLARWCGEAAFHQPLIVSSSRLATLAGKLGFHAPVVASGATPIALAAAVADACDPEDADVDQDDFEKG